MAYDSGFDIEAVMKTLGTISGKYQKDSPEDEALRIAAVALLYVRDLQKLEDYRQYFREFVTGKPIIVSQTFATREEADEWLASGKATDGELVSIAGKGFTAHHLPGGWKFLRARVPEELDPPPEQPDPK